ncbi:MAG: hypothetical protein AAB440_02265 [Patescibacteria group bacterium]
MQKPLSIFIAASILLVGVYFLSQWKPGIENLTNREIALSCTTHAAVSYHVHPELTLIIKGEKQIIPRDIGINALCMRAIHTHTADGTIHIEAPHERDFTLADFFAVWEKPFNETQILEYVANEQYVVTMSVNGEVVDTYENTILRDKDQIVIQYDKR